MTHTFTIAQKHFASELGYADCDEAKIADVNIDGYSWNHTENMVNLIRAAELSGIVPTVRVK